MGFSEQQSKSLTGHVKKRHVRTRRVGGKTLSYLDGWHVIAEANRIFGHDCWDRKTSQPQRVWEQRTGGQTNVLFATNVSITVRAGGSVITREGIGTGLGSSLSPGDAYEIAIKAAETDATKRALATFGNPFGLELYTKRAEPAPCRRDKVARHQPGCMNAQNGSSADYLLVVGTSAPQRIGSVDTLMRLFKSVVDCATEEKELHTLWNSNKALLKRLQTENVNGVALVEELITAFKAKAEALRDARPGPGAIPPQRSAEASEKEQDVPRLLPKERRLRDKEHLGRVRQEPCLVCGRQPSHAHHVRYAQPGAFGMKVSDEYTVPLCALHHDALHRVGNEHAWWTAQGIDPLPEAARLWAASRARQQHAEGEPPPAE